MAGDVGGVSVEARLAQLGDAFKQQGPLRGVRLHDRVLLGRQFAGLVEDGVRDGDLAHIVHDGGEGDLMDGLIIQPVPQRRIGEQVPGDVVDAADVVARFLAAEFNGGGERFDHALVEANDLLRLREQLRLLALDRSAQALSGLKELDDALHAL